MASMTKRPYRIAAWLTCAGLLAAASPLNGGEVLRMRVSPAVSAAPGFLKVQVTLQADTENRLLEVVAESPDFYRSSQVQLDGINAPRSSLFEFRNLPTGVYQITGVLVGTQGLRATVLQTARVAPGVGSQR
jgi:hypothetical protein